MPSLGWRKDPPKQDGEVPDLAAGPHLGAAPIPAAVDNRHLVPSVLDQGHLGSCTANAVMQALRAAHIVELRRDGVTRTPGLGSRLFAYFMARAYHHETAVDNGTYLRFVFASLNKFGFCLEADWPYTDEGDRFARLPSTDAFRSASDQRSPTTYRRISEEGMLRIDVIRRAIAARHLVVFGTLVSEAFCNNELGTDPLTPPTGQMAGGHALCITGYDPAGFDVVNSWGEGWGAAGWCRMAPEYLSWKESDDFWIVESTPLFHEDDVAK